MAIFSAFLSLHRHLHLQQMQHQAILGHHLRTGLLLSGPMSVLSSSKHQKSKLDAVSTSGTQFSFERDHAELFLGNRLTSCTKLSTVSRQVQLCGQHVKFGTRVPNPLAKSPDGWRSHMFCTPMTYCKYSNSRLVILTSMESLTISLTKSMGLTANGYGKITFLVLSFTTKQ
jgi:hypothetical protein